jgi:hypothetical protein
MDVATRRDHAPRHLEDLQEALVVRETPEVAEDHGAVADAPGIPERAGGGARDVVHGEEAVAKERPAYGGLRVAQRQGGGELGAEVVREEPGVDHLGPQAVERGEVPGVAGVHGLEDDRTSREGEPAGPADPPIRPQVVVRDDGVVAVPPEGPSDGAGTAGDADVTHVGVRRPRDLADRSLAPRGREPQVDGDAQGLERADLLDDDALASAPRERRVIERDAAALEGLLRRGRWVERRHARCSVTRSALRPRA